MLVCYAVFFLVKEQKTPPTASEARMTMPASSRRGALVVLGVGPLAFLDRRLNAWAAPGPPPSPAAPAIR